MERTTNKISNVGTVTISLKYSVKSFSVTSKTSLLTFIMFLIAALPSLAQTKHVQNGVEYTLNSDGFAIVSGYTRDLPSEVIILPKITKGNKEYILTSIGKNAFFNCKNISSVTIPESVTAIGEWSFCQCTSLTSVIIPDGVAKIGDYSFLDCSSLTSVIMKEGILEIGCRAFAKCKSLISITIPNSVIRIDSDAFEDIANVNYKGYASGRPWRAKNINGTIDGDFVYSDTDKTKITAYIGKGGDVTVPFGVATIGRYAFQNCTNLTSVHLPSGLNAIDRCAFGYCSNLMSVNIPFGVTIIGDRAFYGCKGLISLTIPSSVKKIGDEAFENIPNVNYSGSHYSMWGAKTINGTIDGDFVYANSEKKQLTAYIGVFADIAIPEGVTSIGTRAFAHSNIKTVIIPESVTSIGWLAFSNCDGLRSVNIPESVTTIGKGAFMNVANINYGGYAADSPWDAKTRNGIIKGNFVYDDVARTQLTAYIGEDSSVTIPQSVKYIRNRAFSRNEKLNENLKVVIIPKNVANIGEGAFGRCFNVTDVYCYANPMYLSWNGEGFMQYGVTKFHVPAIFLAKYKSKFGETANVTFIGDL